MKAYIILSILSITVVAIIYHFNDYSCAPVLYNSRSDQFFFEMCQMCTMPCVFVEWELVHSPLFVVNVRMCSTIIRVTD